MLADFAVNGLFVTSIKLTRDQDMVVLDYLLENPVATNRLARDGQATGGTGPVRERNATYFINCLSKSWKR